MRGSRVEAGSAQRTRSAAPVELQQGSEVHGRANNSARSGGGGPTLKPAGEDGEVGGKGSAHGSAFPLQTAPVPEQKVPLGTYQHLIVGLINILLQEY